jgi:hypothetical protein
VCFNQWDPKPELNEANLSSKSTGWKVLMFARYSGEQHIDGGVRISQGVRLFHTEAGAFVQASCNSNKNADKIDLMYNKHQPYLKPIAYADPLLPVSHSVKQVFVFERAKRSKPRNGYVVWGQDELFRIKHLATRKYLALSRASRDAAIELAQKVS